MRIRIMPFTISVLLELFLPRSRWFLGSLRFVTDKFGDLTLQEPESTEVAKSGTDHLPPAPV
jgi:hypothetical protein